LWGGTCAPSGKVLKHVLRADIEKHRQDEAKQARRP
jgi:hypothetical protein